MTTTGGREQAVARSVVAYLKGQGWEVYQEVATGLGNPVADIVATSGKLSWIVECKTSRTIALVDQARYWDRWATFVSVATPQPKLRSRLGRMGTWHYMLRHFGIGSFAYEAGCAIADFEMAPMLCRRRLKTARIEDYLADAQRSGNYALAGAAGGGHFTAFRDTCEKLRAWVENNPGGRLTDAVKAIEHHYASGASARSSLGRWIADGKVPGIRSECGRLTLV